MEFSSAVPILLVVRAGSIAELGAFQNNSYRTRASADLSDWRTGLVDRRNITKLLAPFENQDYICV
jgi:hypothetical protein